jgi:outer membrane protein assembly factor BamB
MRRFCIVLTVLSALMTGFLGCDDDTPEIVKPAARCSDEVTTMGVSDMLLPKYYAQTGWMTAHRDSRNSDYMPFVMPTYFRLKWSALNRTPGDAVEDPIDAGAATYFGSSRAPTSSDGKAYLWQTSGHGLDIGNFSKIDPDTGAVVWSQAWAGDCTELESCLYQDPDTPDIAACSQSSLIDKDGNVYVADLDQVFKYNPGEGAGPASIEWRHYFNDLLPPPVAPMFSRSFLSMFLTNEGYVGGVTSDCYLLLFDRHSGDVVVAHHIECGSGSGFTKEKSLVFDLFWYPDGEVYFPFRSSIIKGLFGVGPPNVNTPSVDPVSGDIYFVARAPGDEYDQVVAIELGDSGEASVRWSTLIGLHSGASVAISADGAMVYTVDGDGTAYGLDAHTGETVFAVAGSGESAASPTVGMDGNVYLAGGSAMFKLDGKTGKTLQKTSYDDFAQAVLPTLPDMHRPLNKILIGSGVPVAQVMCVVASSANKIWTNVVVGYPLEIMDVIVELIGGTPQPAIVPWANYFVALDPDTLELVEFGIGDDDEPYGSFEFYLGGNEGVTELFPQDGLATISIGDVLGSPIYWNVNSLLPERFRMPDAPSGGVRAFEPCSFLHYSYEGVESTIDQIDDALTFVPVHSETECVVGALQNAFDVVRLARRQLAFTSDHLQEAVTEGQLSQAAATEMINTMTALAADRGDMGRAYDGLIGNTGSNPATPAEQLITQQYLQDAKAELVAISSTLLSRLVEIYDHDYSKICN